MLKDESQPRSTSSGGERLYLAFLFLAWILIAGYALMAGLEYYRLSLPERAYADLHERYKPSGPVGHGLGIAGSLMMIIGVGLYIVRKRFHFLSGLGKLKYWLQFHIFLCTLGPFLVLLHTSFKFGGIVSIAFWSMTIVVFSGVFGRYVYARIPKTLNGAFITRQSIKQHQKRLVDTLRQTAPLPETAIHRLLHSTRGSTPEGFVGAVVLAVQNDFSRRSRAHRLQQELRAFNLSSTEQEKVHLLIEEHAQIELQIALLTPFHTLFNYWHIFHIPLAGVMFFIMIVHVIVAILFGYAWIF